MIPVTHDCLNDPYNCPKDDINVENCIEGEFEPNGCIEDRSYPEQFGFFLQLSLGGPAIGIVFGLVATLWIHYIYNDSLVEISITLVTAYLTFYVAEEHLHVSGVLAVVSLGLFMGTYAKNRVSAQVHGAMHIFWEIMEYLANTLIFVFTGLKVAVEIYEAKQV